MSESGSAASMPSSTALSLATQSMSLNDIHGPRYTSYPTAMQFHEEFTHAQALEQIEASNAARRPLSLYIHIPFCKHVCYYCACNRIVTADTNKAENYLQYLFKEMDYYAPLFSSNRSVIQMHWGGGTPTYLNDAQMTELIYRISSHFNLSDNDDADFSIELDPRTVDEQRLTLIRGLGFTRISFGIQDLTLDVQKAINRVQDTRRIEQLTQAARELGFKSINYDLIYGLPRQTLASVEDTIRQVIKFSPDRVSLYAYAHLPNRFKVQKQIYSEDLPSSIERLHMLERAITLMQENDYAYIGMDHFAKKNDSLAHAQLNGDLHRNFQGYSTCRDSDLIGLGCSSISKVGNAFWQNYKTLDSYAAAIDENQHAIERGYLCHDDDKLRAEVIESLICNNMLNIAAIESKYAIVFADYFRDELNELHSEHLVNLVDYQEHNLTITDAGRYLIRRVCLIFDRYNSSKHSAQAEGQRFSRVI